MGTDIHIFREVRVGGKWQCCEPVLGSKAEERYGGGIPQTAAQEMDFGRWYSLFTILADIRGSTGACMSVIEFPARLDVECTPADVSDSVKAHMDFIKNDKESCVHTFCNLYISELRAYLKHYHDELMLTGVLPSDIVDADDEGSDAYNLIDKFEHGAFKGTPYETDKRMQLYDYIWHNYNPLMDFLTELDMTPCTGEFTGDFSKIDANNRRIIFYFDN